MRHYVIDDMAPGDRKRLAEELARRGYSAGIEGLFWLPVPDRLLTPLQRGHARSCGPHAMAIEMTATGCDLELLVRARNRLRCDCVGPANEKAKAGMIRLLDEILADLDIAC